VIVSIFTELFGVQSYLVNGVRSSTTKSARASLLQPANILDLVVYHREQKNLQRISDIRLAYIYQGLHADVIKNTIALYTVELLYKSLCEPEAHPELFYFISNNLQWMDKQDKGLANFALYLTLKVSEFLGFKFYGKYSLQTPYLDLQEGTYVKAHPSTHLCLEEQNAKLTSDLLHISVADELANIKMSHSERDHLLSAYLEYLCFHLPNFNKLKSPDILKEVLR
jgi:DNA repair protein RecO (recombination protein O)